MGILARSWYGIKQINRVPSGNIIFRTHISYGDIFSLPTNGNVDINVDWGDGSAIEHITTDFPTHEYTINGTTVITITGTSDYYNCETLNFDQNGDIEEYIMFDNLGFKSLAGAFYGNSSLTKIEFDPNFDTSNVTDMSKMFLNCNSLSNINTNTFDTSNVTDMSWMFNECSSFTELNLASFNTSKVTNMHGMFGRLDHIENMYFQTFDTSNVTDMGNMFGMDANQLLYVNNIDISNFDTSNVTDMSDMFWNNFGLLTLDISNFDTSSVTDMRSMFYNCKYMTTLDISNFDTSNVTDMSSMFYECNDFTTLNINFNTSNVTNMNDMFRNVKSLTSLNISNFDTSNVTDMNKMFYFCNKLTTYMDPNKFWNNCNINTHTDTFKGATNISNYNDIPESWGGNAGVSDPCA